jgi:hypothetical protein
VGSGPAEVPAQRIFPIPIVTTPTTVPDHQDQALGPSADRGGPRAGQPGAVVVVVAPAPAGTGGWNVIVNGVWTPAGNSTWRESIET